VNENGFQPGDDAVFSDVLTGPDIGSARKAARDSSPVVRRPAPRVLQPGDQAAPRADRSQGLASVAPRATLAVVGGTGRYANANGHVVVVENGDENGDGDGDGTGSLTVTLH